MKFAVIIGLILASVTISWAANIISYDGCGKTKQCITSPPGCNSNSPPNCDRFLSFYVGNDDEMVFELAAKSQKTPNDFYAGVGFSYGNEMGNAAVTLCTTSASGSVKKLLAFNPHEHDHTEMIGGNFEDTMISNFQGQLIDSTLQCKFNQKIRVPSNVVTGSQNRVYSLDESNFYLLLASGPYNETSNQIGFHYQIPVMSDAAVFLPSVLPNHLPISLISKNGCGYAKGCIAVPDGCEPSVNCQKVLTYTVDNDTATVQFEISAQNPGNDDFYAAVGFSTEGVMANASVSACTVGDGNIDVSMWYNPGPTGHHTSQRINFGPSETTLVQLQEASVINDVLTCRFTQKIDVPSQDSAELGFVVPLDEPYHLLLARGNYSTDTQALRIHTEVPFISNLTNVAGPLNRPETAVSTKECGVTKGCLDSPDTCASNSPNDPCRRLSFVVTADNNWVQFELSGRISKAPQQYDELSMYVAVGFSNNTNMPDTAFTYCMYSSQEQNAQLGFGYVPPAGSNGWSVPGKVKMSNMDQYLKMIDFGVVDDTFVCRFQQIIQPPTQFLGQIPSLHDAHMLYILRGAATKDGDVEMHTEIPVISDTFMNVTDIKNSALTTPSPPSSGCGNKGCVRSPSTCTPSVDCDASLTYIIDSTDPRYVDFELSLKVTSISGTPYVAVGFSFDQYMGDDAVTMCYQNGISQYYNPGPASSHQASQKVDVGTATDIVKLDNVAMSNGILVCKFKQLITPPTNLQSKIYPLNTKLFQIFLARGPLNSDNSLGEHLGRPFISSPVNVTSTQSGGASTSVDVTILVKKAHGCLMIIGWWVFIVNGILIARYFKSVINQEIGGIKLWFHLHRAVNSLGLLCILTAFVCILYARKGEWGGGDPGAAATHSILGLTAVIGGMLNPIMAIIRCHPGTTLRPVFNLFHRAIGIGAWVCASAAIFEVSKSPFLYDLTEDGRYGKIPRGLMYAYFIGLGVAVLILEELMISFEGKPSTSPLFVKQTSPEYQMTNGTHGSAPDAPPVIHTRFGTLRLVTLLLFNMLAVCVSIIEASFVGLANFNAQ